MTTPLCPASRNTSKVTKRVLLAPHMKHSTGTSPLLTVQRRNLRINRRKLSSLLMKPGHKLLSMPSTLPWRNKKAGLDLTPMGCFNYHSEEDIAVVWKLLISLVDYSLTDLDRYEADGTAP